MAQVGKLTMSFGFVSAPWLPALAWIGHALVSLGCSKERAIKILLPLCGLGWTQVGGGRRNYFVLWPSRPQLHSIDWWSWR